MSLDNFPTRDDNSQLSAQAETIFERAVVDAGHFVVQQRDRHDYGSDFQIEATHLGSVTNFRVHVQLKATDKAPNKDGSVSISVSRTNLNYMLSQPNSVYVCYHAPTNSLLVRSAEDVFRDAEHQDEQWRSQESVTVRFVAPFNQEFQANLRARTVATSTTQRNERLLWVTTPPDKYPEEVATNVPTIAVPDAPRDAFHCLESLYQRGQDDVISKAFEQFLACIGPDNPGLVYAYLSEINLAMRGKGFNSERVNAAIRFIENARKDNVADALYCRANGHSALGQRDDSKRLYLEAIQKADGANSHLEAQCWKNLGSDIEKEGDQAEANRCYEKALLLAPQLMEAHMALAISFYKSGDLESALRHFDAVVWSVSDVTPTLAARGYRVDVYFRLGRTDNAYDDIAAILPHGERHRWIFPWCARLVYNYARTNDSSITRAMRFWDAFLRLQTDDRKAQKERLLCLAFAKIHGHPVDMNYQQYRIRPTIRTLTPVLA
jgi:tetratricopeptide (TPR) repeat protein